MIFFTSASTSGLTTAVAAVVGVETGTGAMFSFFDFLSLGAVDEGGTYSRPVAFL